MKYTQVSYKLAREIYNINPFHTIYMLPKRVSIYNYEDDRFSVPVPPIFCFSRNGQQSKINSGYECFGYDDFDKVVGRYRVCDTVICCGGNVSYYVRTSLYDRLKSEGMITDDKR